MRVHAPHDADRVRVVQELADPVLEKRRARLAPALDAFSYRRADHADEQEDKDDPDRDFENPRPEHGGSCPRSAKSATDAAWVALGVVRLAPAPVAPGCTVAR